eukprot:1173477-Prorocentrum_minimum.AAC.3
MSVWRGARLVPRLGAEDGLRVVDEAGDGVHPTALVVGDVSAAVAEADGPLVGGDGEPQRRQRQHQRLAYPAPVFDATRQTRKSLT